jgi:hypothetical protein
LKEKDFIALTEILNNISSTNKGSSKSNLSTDSKNNSNDNRDSLKFRKILFNESLTKRYIIISNSKSSNISKNSNKDN